MLLALAENGLAGFGRRVLFPFARLDFVFAHSDGPIATMELIVEPTGIAHG